MNAMAALIYALSSMYGFGTLALQHHGSHKSTGMLHPRQLLMQSLFVMQSLSTRKQYAGGPSRLPAYLTILGASAALMSKASLLCCLDEPCRFAARQNTLHLRTSSLSLHSCQHFAVHLEVKGCILGSVCAQLLTKVITHC